MQQDPLLATKLYIPSIRLELVSRPRLIERLNEGHRSGCKLTLISAPAGFGKTTLVSEWVNHLRLDAANENQFAHNIASLSLDEGDNDPVRLGKAETQSSSKGNGVTGQENGGEMLEALERGNLFVIPLDDKRRW